MAQCRVISPSTPSTSSIATFSGGHEICAAPSATLAPAVGPSQQPSAAPSPPPSCHPRCRIQCEYGFVVGSEGCVLCRCNLPPWASTPAPSSAAPTGTVAPTTTAPTLPRSITVPLAVHRPVEMAISGNAVIYKGSFKHCIVQLRVWYSAPPSYHGQVDLVPVVKSDVTGSAHGVVDSGRTAVLNRRTLYDLPATGSTLVAIQLLSSVAPGGYTANFAVLPAGRRYSDRFEAAPHARKHHFVVVIEYVQLPELQSHPDPPRVVAAPITPAGPPNVVVPVRYFSATPVKFAVQVRCVVAPHLRVGAWRRCHGGPVYVNTVAPQYGQACTPGASPINVTLVAGLMSYIPVGVNYSVSVAMGRYCRSAPPQRRHSGITVVSQWYSSGAALSAPARQNFFKYKNNSAVKISLSTKNVAVMQS